MIQQVIIQAGGRGTRLETLTRNRPKCLVPVDGRPLLYHTFAAFPGASFTIIVDYRGEVVRRFLDAFPPGVPVRIVEADGDGTCGGIAKAVQMLPFPEKAFVIVWSDLVFDRPMELEEPDDIGITVTNEFPCRFGVGKGLLSGERRPVGGVMGLFAFAHRKWLDGIPKSGEFVQWLYDSGQPFVSTEFHGVREYGTAQALRDHWDAAPASRWFNEVIIADDWVEKVPRSPDAARLLDDEAAWYQKAAYFDFPNVPRIHSICDALQVERIHGRHPFEMEPSADKLHAIMDTLFSLHTPAPALPSRLAIREMYADKPRARLAHIPKLAPDFAVRDTIRINGRACRNPLRHPHMFTDLLADLTSYAFAFIHGDPTFSNMLIDDAGKVWLIDPRGRFGSVQFYGDPAYDWAKLWYSVVGGYDQFNRKRFVLTLGGPTVEIEIAPSGWEHLAPVVAERLGPDMMRRVRVLHGLIWLSLSGYVTDCYDSMLGAWFKGMLELETALA